MLNFCRTGYVISIIYVESRGVHGLGKPNKPSKTHPNRPKKMGLVGSLGKHGFKNEKPFKIIGLWVNPHPTHKTHGLLSSYFLAIFYNLMGDYFDVFNLNCFNYNLLNIFYFISNDFNLFRMLYFDYFDANSCKL